MNNKEFTIYYTDSKNNHGKGDIEVDLVGYGEMLSEKLIPSDEDEFIIDIVKSQVNVELKKRNIEDFETLKKDIRASYKEYKQEMIPADDDE